MGIFDPFGLQQFIITKSIDRLLIRCDLMYYFCQNVEGKRKKRRKLENEKIIEYIMNEYNNQKQICWCIKLAHSWNKVFSQHWTTHFKTSSIFYHIQKCTKFFYIIKTFMIYVWFQKITYFRFLYFLLNRISNVTTRFFSFMYDFKFSLLKFVCKWQIFWNMKEGL